MGKTRRVGRPTKAPKSGERVPLGLRVTADIKRKLDAAAEKSGRSQSQEAELRIEQSFSRDDAFGGAELREIAILMAASFSHAGKMSAGGKPPSEWINDPAHYSAAVVGVMKALLIGLPNSTPNDVALLFDSLRGRIAGAYINQNPLSESTQ
jgi:hypothetical protein